MKVNWNFWGRGWGGVWIFPGTAHSEMESIDKSKDSKD